MERCSTLSALVDSLEGRNSEVFESMEMNFVQLRNSLLSCIFFWCTHEIPFCIENCVRHRKSNVFVSFLLSVYFLYTSGFVPTHLIKLLLF